MKSCVMAVGGWMPLGPSIILFTNTSFIRPKTKTAKSTQAGKGNKNDSKAYKLQEKICNTMQLEVARRHAGGPAWALIRRYNAPVYNFNNSSTFVSPQCTYVPNFSGIEHSRAETLRFKDIKFGRSQG